MEGGVTLGDRFFAAVGRQFTTLGPNSLEELLDQRDALLEACKALQSEARARGCGLRIADEAIAKAERAGQ